MDGTRFDTITQRLTNGASRRQLVGGLLGGAAALLTGAAALDAKKGGNGKGKAKGHAKGKGKGSGKGKNKGKGNGTTKVLFCHRNKKGQSFNLISVGSPASNAHLNHGDVLCEAVVCQTATGCESDGTCTLTPAAEGTACVVGDVAGTCDGAGACVTV